MARPTTLTEWRKKGAADAIAHIALEMFLRDGFDATSVEAIAAAAGCSPRTFYRYFGTKEDVMFHDLPIELEQLAADLEEQLAAGHGPWTAASETLVNRIARFGVDDPSFPTRRLNLWLSEPALLTRYMQYMNRAEQVIAECLHTHRGTVPQGDDLPQIVAVAAVGAYRVTLLTHTPAGNHRLVEHLRAALDRVGDGLADDRAAGSADGARVRRQA
jgi:AcrR family transcriptional regulator